MYNLRQSESPSSHTRDVYRYTRLFIDIGSSEEEEGGSLTDEVKIKITNMIVHVEYARQTKKWWW